MIKNKILLLTLTAFFCCKNPEAVEIHPLMKYVGSYPYIADHSKGIEVPLVENSLYQEILEKYMPEGLIAEIKTLTTSTPIELIDSRYLLIKLCEPMNCIHDAGILIDTQKEHISVFLRSGNIAEAESGMRCFSSNNWQFSDMSESASKSYWESMAFAYDIPKVGFKCHNKQYYKDYQPQQPVDHSNG